MQGYVVELLDTLVPRTPPDHLVILGPYVVISGRSFTVSNPKLSIVNWPDPSLPTVWLARLVKQSGHIV